MRLSFDDTESFKEVVGSLRFNNPPSDPNSSTSSTSSMPPLQVQEKSEDTWRRYSSKLVYILHTYSDTQLQLEYNIWANWA